MKAYLDSHESQTAQGTLHYVILETLHQIESAAVWLCMDQRSGTEGS